MQQPKKSVACYFIFSATFFFRNNNNHMKSTKKTYSNNKRLSNSITSTTNGVVDTEYNYFSSSLFYFLPSSCALLLYSSSSSSSTFSHSSSTSHNHKSRSTSISQNEFAEKVLLPNDFKNHPVLPEHQTYAARLILPISTIGYLCMLYAFNYYLGHKDLWNYLEVALWPSAAFSCAWLLWHRYQASGWRRNLDICMTVTAITVQTYTIMTRCPCEFHLGSYIMASIVGLSIYAAGVFAGEFRKGMKFHVMTHLVAYVCNAILFRCLGEYHQE
jgi:hypothetical protein